MIEKEVEQLEKIKTDEEIRKYLFELTGEQYVMMQLCTSVLDENDPRRNVEGGNLFQLMPEINQTDDFFNWYCHVRKQHQFMETTERCFLYFLHYWLIWNVQGRPDFHEVFESEHGKPISKFKKNLI
ncbi:hypothetical protein [Aquimarina aggregata]|uniref:hypothetical protein n=1 Tax=Aquimarina aggregata TaxID=1642818 RepID=UPI0024903263|nr:hypothetical protein [Aquimarina aggregata]